MIFCGYWFSCLLLCKDYGGVLDTLMIDMLKKKFQPPGCDVILVNDDLFSHQMLRWVSTLNDPVYSLSLHVHTWPPNPKLKWVKNGKSSRPSCSTVVIACQSIHTCKPNRDSYQLQHLLNIMESERRVYIFIMSGSSESELIPYARCWVVGIMIIIIELLKYLETTSSLDSIIPGSINSKGALKIMDSINDMFGILRVHFTLIRKLKPKYVKESASARDVYQVQ